MQNLLEDINHSEQVIDKWKLIFCIIYHMNHYYKEVKLCPNKLKLKK
jgi:hypothetical protein